MNGAALDPVDLAALHSAGAVAQHFGVDVEAVLDALHSAPVHPLSLLDRPEGLTALGEFLRHREELDASPCKLVASPFMVTIH